MPSHSIVQSVLLNRGTFKTLDSAKDWLVEHGYKYTLPDVTPTYYRFRQHDPAPLALTHRLRTTQLGEPEKFSPMGSVGALIIAYPKDSRPMAKEAPTKKDNLMDELKVGDLVRVEFTVDIRRKRETMIVVKKTEKSVTVRRGTKQGSKKFVLNPRASALVFRKIGTVSGLPETADMKYTILSREARDITAILPEEDTDTEVESD